MTGTASATVLSLGQLLEQQSPSPPACLVEPGLLPAQGILFVGGEPKVGKSLLVANLALSLAAGCDRLGFPVPAPRRVLVCQFELPIPQFVSRLATMRRVMGPAADQNLFIDTRATGHLLSAPQGLQHFLAAAQAAAAEIIILDPLYSTHDQDENDTRAMAALCQSLLRLRETSRVALIVVHHVRKSIGRYEIGSAFRGSSALHAVGDSYLLLTRPGAPVQHRRAPLPVSLCGGATAALAPARSPLAVVFPRRRGSRSAACRTQGRKSGRHRGNDSARRRGALQPAPPANHDADRVFQTHHATGYHRGVPARLDRAL